MNLLREELLDGSQIVGGISIQGVKFKGRVYNIVVNYLVINVKTLNLVLSNIKGHILRKRGIGDLGWRRWCRTSRKDQQGKYRIE